MKAQALIVADSLTVRMDLRSTLTSAGFSVTACETLLLARKVLRDREFSLVILDLVLPDGSGVDLLWELRTTPDFAAVPIIALTAESEVRHRITGMSRGADEYIAKPYDRSYLALRATLLVDRRREARAATSERGSLAGKKLLVVDDSPTYREAIGQMLRREGCNVLLASSGEEALELLAVEQVDCVIIDFLMPGMGGMEVTAQIKANPALAGTPVVILAGLDHPHVRAQAAASGVDALVLKSPELPLLGARLKHLFSRKAEAGARPPSAQVARTPPPPPPSWGASPGDQVAPPRDDRHASSLLTKVIAASGLSSAIAPSTIFRACKSAGVEPMSMSPSDLSRAVPAIQETLRFFLTEEEYGRSMAAIVSLVRHTAVLTALLAALALAG